MDSTEFLKKHGFDIEAYKPETEASKMSAVMAAGLKTRDGELPMIPTYISNDNEIRLNQPVVVIDAGGTNFRASLVTLREGGYKTEQTIKTKMPGTDHPATWEEFTSFTVDKIAPLLSQTDYIGFCFSFNANVTPEIDAVVNCIDKEVVITGCEGKYVGRSVIEELERRGITGKKIVILNDTIAVLLGGSAVLDRKQYDGFIGQVSGTGTNTCCEIKCSEIEKITDVPSDTMLINLESGMYSGLPLSEFDIALDKNSNDPGLKFFEKMTAGVYLGRLFRIIAEVACREGLLSEKSGERIRGIDNLDSSYVDAWSCGENRGSVFEQEEMEFARTVAYSLIERSARCMCTNLLAIALLNGKGRNKEKPLCVCAEGSLVQRSHFYSGILEKLLKECGEEKLGLYLKLVIGNESTLPGSAAAALMNL